MSVGLLFDQMTVGIAPSDGPVLDFYDSYAGRSNNDDINVI